MKTALILMCCLLLGSCTVMRPLPAGDGRYLDLKPGDEIRVRTADGRFHEFVLEENLPDSLIGEDSAFDKANIVHVERKSFSMMKTLGRTAAYTAGVVAAGAIGIAVLLSVLIHRM